MESPKYTQNQPETQKPDNSGLGQTGYEDLVFPTKKLKWVGVSEIFGLDLGFVKFWVFLHTLPVLLNRDDKSIISALRSSSATWLEVLTNRGSPTQILILSVLELQSSCVLLVVDPIEP